jgi:hypothetical protein
MVPQTHSLKMLTNTIRNIFGSVCLNGAGIDIVLTTFDHIDPVVSQNRLLIFDALNNPSGQSGTVLKRQL